MRVNDRGLSRSAPPDAHFAASMIRMEAPENSPRSPPNDPGSVQCSPQFAPADPGSIDEDDGVFLLEDEDEEPDEEEVPEESTTRNTDMVDFGLEMTEYDPDDYVPSYRRNSGSVDHGSVPRGSLPMSLPKADEFLANGFVGSPRLQNALQSLKAEVQVRSRTTSMNEAPGIGSPLSPVPQDRFFGAVR
jgi:hypothetical protein